MFVVSLLVDIFNVWLQVSTLMFLYTQLYVFSEKIDFANRRSRCSETGFTISRIK